MSSPGGQGRRRDLPAAADRIHPTVSAVFEALESAGVRWCVLRGEARLESPPHDVDLLVAPSDLVAFYEAVHPLGFVAVPTWGRGSHRFFVAYLPSFEQWLLLDVVTELSYGPGYAIGTHAGDACLARRERIGSLALLSGDDAFWTLLLHCLLDRRDIAEHHRERLVHLRPGASSGSTLGRFADGLCPPGWGANRILATVGQADWPGLSRLGQQMTRQWRRRHPVRYRAAEIADRARWRVAPLHTAVALRGLIVTIAADRAEAAQRVAAELRGAFYFPVHVLDGGPARNLSRRPRARIAAGAVAGLVARYHAARGRLVVAPTSGGTARSTRPVLWGADLQVVLGPGGSNARSEVVSSIWRAYGRRRRWSVA